MHLKFNLLEEKPVGAVVTSARRCERAVLRTQLVAGEFYVGDRYYGEDYALFSELERAGCFYLLRLRQEARFEVMEEWPLSAADQAATRHLRWIGALGSGSLASGRAGASGAGAKRAGRVVAGE